MENEYPMNITRVANAIFAEICDAYQSGDSEAEKHLTNGLQVVEQIEKAEAAA